MADTAAINSPDYWNRRFALDWTERGGAEQTAFFAQLAVKMLPDWFWRDATENALSLIDIGCALGEALPDFKAQMPQSALSGADVSDVAIRMAKARLPEFAFHVVAADWSDVPAADIAFCSNTLEHLEDWRARLVKLGALARRYVVALVPFQERDMIEEHVAAFDFDSFPAELPDGKRLIFFRILDATAEPNTYWQGHQALALYGPSGQPRKNVPASFDAYAGVNLRGLTPAQIETAMASLRTSETSPKWVQALAPRQSSDPTQRIVDRINDEWQQKFTAANADYMAKHAEMKAYYERTLSERDAKIVLFDQLMSARVELERARTVAEFQAADLKREREQSAALRASLARLPGLEEESKQLATTKIIVAEREAALKRLEAALKSSQADVTAAKAGLRVAIDERDEARRNAAAPLAEAERLRAELAFAYAEKERHERNVVTIKDHYEGFADNLKAELAEALEARDREVAQAEEARRLSEAEIVDLKRLMEAELQGAKRLRESEALETRRRTEAELQSVREEKDLHERTVTEIRNHYEAHLRGINARLATFAAEMQGALEAVRSAWRGDLSRGVLDQQYARELRDLLSQILASKSWAMTMRVRRFYALARGGDPTTPGVPQPPAGTQDRASDFTARFDLARGVLDQIAADPNLAGASDLQPAVHEVAPAISAPGQYAPVVSTGGGPRGTTFAMQVASLANGGLERVVLDLCVGLQQRGVRVLVIAVTAGGPIGVDLRQRGIDVFEINKDKDAYERVLREQGVSDLFLHHNYFGFEQATGAGVRLYDVVHNYYFWHRDKVDLIHSIAERCERVIYVSSAVRQFHERVFSVSHDRGVVINNPAHLDGLLVPDKAQLARLRGKAQDTTFLNVAQAFPAKAQAAMVTAFARAHRVAGGMRLQIAGAPVRDDAARAVRERIVEEGVEGAVELLGHCDRRAMSKLYTQAHAFALPSLYEGYSVSAIEAATYGLPLIMTDVGGARDLIENGGCGLLLPPVIPDLAQLDVRSIEQTGLAPENGATAALEQAFCDVAANRAAWMQRGLDARFNVRTLDEAIDAYLAVAGAAVTARR